MNTAHSHLPTTMTMTRRHLLLAVYCLSVALLFLPTLNRLVEYSRSDVAASHIVLIPFVSIALIYQSRNTIFKTAPLVGKGAVVALLSIVGVGLWTRFGLVGGAPNLTLAAAWLVILWLVGFLVVYGWQSFQAALFPLVFLGFIVPFPEPLLNGAIVWLKTWSAESVAVAFTVTGTPFYREGYSFTLPNMAIEIADECSGIRSSIALLLTGVLAGHLFLTRPWTKVTLVAAVLPLAVLKNAIRIAGLSLLAVYVDPGFLTGQLHHEGGIVFFLLALAVLFPFFVLLRRFEGARRRV